MKDCLFCKIAAGQIPSDKVFEDENTLIFRDINPAAPTHLLAIPKEHFRTIQEIPAGRMDVMEKLFDAIAKTVIRLNLGSSGYRIVINSGEHAASWCRTSMPMCSPAATLPGLRGNYLIRISRPGGGLTKSLVMLRRSSSSEVFSEDSVSAVLDSVCSSTRIQFGKVAPAG